MDYKQLASEILKNIGGVGNVDSVTHCATRLRFQLKDESKADAAAIEKLKGVFSVVNKNGQFQVVIGNNVPNVYRELVNIGHFDTVSNSGNSVKKKFKISDIFEIISSIFVPCIPAIAGCGLLKGFLSLFVTFGWIDAASQTYAILNIMGDAGFYFLPMLLAYTTAQRFKVNPFYAVVLAGVLLHPNLSTLLGAGETVKFLGMTVTNARYSSSVIPVILAVWVMHYVQSFFERYVPKSLRIIFVPLCTLLVMAPITLIFIGPLGTVIGDLLAKGIMFLDGKASWLIPTLIGAFTPLLVMTGMHYSLFPGVFQQLAASGYQTITPGMLPSNIAQAGAALAVGVKSKNKEMKELGFSTGVTALMGITEPALYGVTMKLKKPLYAVMMGGALGGFFMGITNVHSFTPNGASLLQIGVYFGGDSINNVLYVLIGSAIAFAASFILTFVLGFDDPKNEENKSDAVSKEEHVKSVVLAPVSGKTVALKDTSSQTFSSEVMGKGIAIVPDNETVVSPVEGTVTALYHTNHSIGITSSNGIEILIHVGIGTVELDGKGFIASVKQGDKVKAGQELLKFDAAFIKENGYDPTTVIIITNSSDYLEIIPTEAAEVKAGDRLITIL